ncbi:hypothetical protein ACN2XU_12550 [Primorskyibacter sp. 2E107]|uniref:hypothetical protein n=1 Tax=Primorskyibacter sp. 2E107 TaxID=3403458 RepID=UPI003AF42FA4
MNTLAADVQRRTPVEISLSGFFYTLMLMFLGSVLCIAAIGLWLTGGSDGMPEAMLMKLWTSVLLIAAGLFLLFMARKR